MVVREWNVSLDLLRAPGSFKGSRIKSKIRFQKSASDSLCS